MVSREFLRRMFRACCPPTHCPEWPLATVTLNRHGEVLITLTDEAAAQYEKATGQPPPASQVLCHLIRIESAPTP